jgi:hypothetical protein
MFSLNSVLFHTIVVRKNSRILLFTFSICLLFWTTGVASVPVVDLGYSIYQGILDLEYDVNVFKG